MFNSVVEVYGLYENECKNIVSDYNKEDENFILELFNRKDISAMYNENSRVHNLWMGIYENSINYDFEKGMLHCDIGINKFQCAQCFIEKIFTENKKNGNNVCCDDDILKIWDFIKNKGLDKCTKDDVNGLENKYIFDRLYTIIKKNQEIEQLEEFIDGCEKIGFHRYMIMRFNYFEYTKNKDMMFDIIDSCFSNNNFSIFPEVIRYYSLSHNRRKIMEEIEKYKDLIPAEQMEKYDIYTLIYNEYKTDDKNDIAEEYINKYKNTSAKLFIESYINKIEDDFNNMTDDEPAVVDENKKNLLENLNNDVKKMLDNNDKNCNKLIKKMLDFYVAINNIPCYVEYLLIGRSRNYIDCIYSMIMMISSSENLRDSYEMFNEINFVACVKKLITCGVIIAHEVYSVYLTNKINGDDYFKNIITMTSYKITVATKEDLENMRVFDTLGTSFSIESDENKVEESEEDMSVKIIDENMSETNNSNDLSIKNDVSIDEEESEKTDVSTDDIIYEKKVNNKDNKIKSIISKVNRDTVTDEKITYEEELKKCYLFYIKYVDESCSAENKTITGTISVPQYCYFNNCLRTDNVDEIKKIVDITETYTSMRYVSLVLCHIKYLCSKNNISDAINIVTTAMKNPDLSVENIYICGCMLLILHIKTNKYDEDFVEFLVEFVIRIADINNADSFNFLINVPAEEYKKFISAKVIDKLNASKDTDVDNELNRTEMINEELYKIIGMFNKYYCVKKEDYSQDIMKWNNKKLYTYSYTLKVVMASIIIEFSSKFLNPAKAMSCIEKIFDDENMLEKIKNSYDEIEGIDHYKKFHAKVKKECPICYEVDEIVGFSCAVEHYVCVDCFFKKMTCPFKCGEDEENARIQTMNEALASLFGAFSDNLRGNIASSANTVTNNIVDIDTEVEPEIIENEDNEDCEDDKDNKKKKNKKSFFSKLTSGFKKTKK
jgi:hypothetical protein